MCEGFCYFLKRSHYNGHIHQFSNPCINSKDEVSSAPSCEECRTSLNMCGDLFHSILHSQLYGQWWLVYIHVYSLLHNYSSLSHVRPRGRVWSNMHHILDMQVLYMTTVSNMCTVLLDQARQRLHVTYCSAVKL